MSSINFNQIPFEKACSQLQDLLDSGSIQITKKNNQDVIAHSVHIPILGNYFGTTEENSLAKVADLVLRFFEENPDEAKKSKQAELVILKLKERWGTKDNVISERILNIQEKCWGTPIQKLARSMGVDADKAEEDSKGRKEQTATTSFFDTFTDLPLTDQNKQQQLTTPTIQLSDSLDDPITTEAAFDIPSTPEPNAEPIATEAAYDNPSTSEPNIVGFLPYCTIRPPESTRDPKMGLLTFYNHKGTPMHINATDEEIAENSALRDTVNRLQEAGYRFEDLRKKEEESSSTATTAAAADASESAAKSEDTATERGIKETEKTEQDFSLKHFSYYGLERVIFVSKDGQEFSCPINYFARSPYIGLQCQEYNNDVVFHKKKRSTSLQIPIEIYDARVLKIIQDYTTTGLFPQNITEDDLKATWDFAKVYCFNRLESWCAENYDTVKVNAINAKKEAEIRVRNEQAEKSNDSETLYQLAEAGSAVAEKKLLIKDIKDEWLLKYALKHPYRSFNQDLIQKFKEAGDKVALQKFVEKDIFGAAAALESLTQK